LLFVAVIAAIAAPVESHAVGFDGRWRSHQISQQTPWHGAYQHTSWESPVALVVPPTVGIQTDWGWGVGANRISRVHHQFGRRYPAVEGANMPFAATPNWPYDTTQFGVYYVRGPW
jgi:hypothetical protein